MPPIRRFLQRLRVIRPRGRSKSARLLVAFVSGLAAAAAGVALILAPDEADSARVHVVAGPDRAVTVDRVSIDAHSSPTIVRDPNDMDRLAVADKVDRPRFSAAVHVSDDGGSTWVEAPFPTPRGEDRPYAPDLAWAADGTLFMVFVTLAGPGNSPGAVWLASSRDGGRSWGRPRRVLGRYAFQVRLAVDPRGDGLHMTWLQATEDAISCVNCFAETGLPILASRSSDGGASWSDPARVSSPTRARVGAPVPVVAPSGELYVLYRDFGGDRFLWQDLEGASYRGTYGLVLSRGGRGARRFREAVVEPQVVPGDPFLVYLPESPSLAVDPNRGTLYAAWTDSRGGDRDVYLRRSEDGGRSWTDPRRVNPRMPRDQYQPQVSVAPGGRVDVAYLDRHDDPRNVLTAAAFATSYDAARTWSTIALSDRLFDSRVGPHDVLRGRERPEANQGTRLGLISGPGTADAVWADARRGDSTTGKLDIFFSRIRFIR